MNSDGERDLKILQLERRVAALEAHLGLKPPPPDATEDPEVLALIKTGDLPGAMRLLRSIEDCSLGDAKARIDAIVARTASAR